jgi:phage gp29-like protein
MAEDTQAVPPLPERGEIVSTAALYSSQIAGYRNTLAFAGARNPSMMWSSMVRNDGSAILYYRELEMKDVDVANGIDTLKGTVIERTHGVTPADSSPLAEEVAQFVRDQLAGIPNFEGMLDTLLDAPGYGFSVQELLFDTSMGQAQLLDIKDCPQELFLFGNRYEPQIGPLQLLDSPYATTGAKVPENKFLVYSYRPRSRDRMGRPLLRDIFWESWFKRNAQSMWLRYAEKGPGTVVVRYKDGADAQERQQAADIAQMIADLPSLGVPEGFQYDQELLKIARSLDPAVFEHLYEALQLNIIRRLLGETLTSFGGEKGKGTQALGEVHSDTLEKKSIGICKAAASVVQRQLVRPLVLWNFGPKAPMPRWGWEIEQAEDLDKKLNRDKILQGMGLPYTKEYLSRTYEVPLPQAGETVVGPNPNTPDIPADPDAEDVTFAELRDQARVNRQLKEFDRVMGQLKTQSRGLLSSRVGEIVDALDAGVR